MVEDGRHVGLYDDSFAVASQTVFSRQTLTIIRGSLAWLTELWYYNRKICRFGRKLDVPPGNRAYTSERENAMISILHLSDLHIVQSGQRHNLRPCILKEGID